MKNLVVGSVVLAVIGIALWVRMNAIDPLAPTPMAALANRVARLEGELASARRSASSLDERLVGDGESAGREREALRTRLERDLRDRDQAQATYRNTNDERVGSLEGMVKSGLEEIRSKARQDAERQDRAVADLRAADGKHQERLGKLEQAATGASATSGSIAKTVEALGREIKLHGQGRLALNRAVFGGAGIINDGLKVRGEAGDGEVTVQPGLAIDAMGNELYIVRPQVLRFDDLKRDGLELNVVVLPAESGSTGGEARSALEPAPGRGEGVLAGHLVISRGKLVSRDERGRTRSLFVVTSSGD